MLKPHDKASQIFPSAELLSHYQIFSKRLGSLLLFLLHNVLCVVADCGIASWSIGMIAKLLFGKLAELFSCKLLPELCLWASHLFWKEIPTVSGLAIPRVPGEFCCTRALTVQLYVYHCDKYFSGVTTGPQIGKDSGMASKWSLEFQNMPEASGLSLWGSCSKLDIVSIHPHDQIRPSLLLRSPDYPEALSLVVWFSLLRSCDLPPYCCVT